jgi:hypothetical protein
METDTNTRALADYENAFRALNEALNTVDSVHRPEGTEDSVEVLTARVDVMRYKLHMINETLASVLRAVQPEGHMATTRIGDRNVEIKSGPRSIIYFSHGWRDAHTPETVFEFWTATSRDDRKICTARSPIGEDPGDRFRLAECKPGEKTCWTALCNEAAYIRPSKLEEVESWITETLDAECVEYGSIDGKAVKVVKEGARRTFVYKT